MEYKEQDGMAVYRLTRDTARIAEEIFNDTHIGAAFQHRLQWDTRQSDHADRDWDAVFEQRLAELKRDAPEKLAHLGLCDQSRATVVHTYIGGEPRAYLASPTVYLNDNDGQFYLFAPIDYRGSHFKPRH